MRNKILLFLISSVIMAFSFGCRRETNEKNIIRIAAASNLRSAAEELISEFEKNSDNKCELVLSSSGKLYAQIIEGAPYDIFLSADLYYPQEIYNKRLGNAPKVFAYGTLILWTRRQDITPTISILDDEIIKQIAIPNPRVAPYGKSAIEVLKYYGLNEKLDSKLVFGESIGQTNQFIVSGAADIGFTAFSVIKSPKAGVSGNWMIVDKNSYPNMPHGAVILNSKGEIKSGVTDFYKYLFSSEGKQVLQKFGYSVDE